MKSLVKKILFCAVILCGFIGMLCLKMPLHTDTDLISLIQTQSNDYWPTNQISDKFSSVINIVIESNNEKLALNTTKSIANKIQDIQFNTLKLQTNNVSLKPLVKDLIPYKNGLLSIQDKEILQQNRTKQITDNAIKTISQSMMPLLVSVKDDPFLLLSDYIIGIGNNNPTWTLHNGFLWQYKNGKNHFMLPVDTNLTNASEFAKQVNLLKQELNKHQTTDVQIHISGAPLHTAFMVQKSQIQLGILSFLAILTAVLFNYLLFKKIFTLLPVLTSLAVGFFTGTIALFLCFDTPHILTFVFGTTLIGLGIDYAFHFMTGATLKNQDNIQRNMFYSFVTTIICFMPLLFSHILLLRQMSVFTITGLTTIYIGLLLFMPNRIKLTLKSKKPNLSLSHKQKNIILAIISVIILVSMPFVKIENNVSQMYRPNPEILEQDIYFQNLNNSKQSKFLLVRGENIESVLQTEEDIKKSGTQFFSVSDIIPSGRNQKENQDLIKYLYETKSSYLQKKLELRNKPVFEKTDILTIYDIKSDYIKNWINKLIIQDDNYVYSISQIDAASVISTQNAKAFLPNDIISQNIKQFSDETYKMLGICALCLIAVLFFIYKRRALIYILPSFFGICLTISVLTWFGQPITFFHLLSFFIVIGLSIDYTIFNINTDDDKESRTVLYSFLTSFVGFGLLAFTSFFLIQSMGITLGLGLLFSYLVSRYLLSNNKRM